MPVDEPLVPCFTPALVALLLNREQTKGAPLTEDEVLRIRDEATVVMLPESVAAAMAESRGYDDVDPDRVWEDWQRVRRSLT